MVPTATSSTRGSSRTAGSSRRTSGTIADPDVTVTAPYAEWVKIARGELDMSAAFMQGVIKVAGDTGKWLHLLPITRTLEYTGLQAEIRAITEYPDA